MTLNPIEHHPVHTPRGKEMGMGQTEAKHTPGPWVAIFPEARYFHEQTDITSFDVMTEKTRRQLREEGHTHYREDREGVDNVSIVNTQFWRDMLDEEAKANARLIAAAPELLADLVEAAKTLRRYESLHLAKGTPESLEKASVNAALATRFENTIARATGAALAKAQGGV